MKKEVTVIINEMQSNEKKVIVNLMEGKKLIAKIKDQKIYIEKSNDEYVYSIFSGETGAVEQMGLESLNQAVRIACEKANLIEFLI